jgi:hypothetical protein
MLVHLGKTILLIFELVKQYYPKVLTSGKLISLIPEALKA